MELARYADAESFLAAAGEFLGAREAEHNLILGLSSRLLRDPLMYGEPPYFAVVEDGGGIVGAAMRTPPHNLILSELDVAEAVAALAADAREVFDSLPGVVGPKQRAAQFANVWRGATGATPRLEIAQRVFAADHVDEPRPASGSMRDYERGDREVAIRWMDEFVAEALPPNAPQPESGEEFVDRREQDPDAGLVIWDDGGPVSMAGFGGRTPNGIRVGPVYTPPDLRGRGYASALTAALTLRLLDAGRRFCFLYTDLANPTANSIYQRIGYRPVGDADFWSFSG
ncbi:MAG TPA: GNAT family N-acetyltransferase [Gaiellaceae bacterium]|nr:GNAT family N-acetyltransferase [Gaiellaceae bacterium]